MNSPQQDMLIQLGQYLVAFWLLGWALYSIRRIAQGDGRTVLFVQIIYFLFIGVPLFLDLLVAQPEYPYQWGFIVSQYDHDTNAVYLFYIAFCPVVFSRFGGRATLPGSQFTATGPELRLRKWVRAFSWIALISVPIAIATAPNPSIYLQYAVLVTANHTDAVQSHHLWITASAKLAVIAGVLILAARNSHELEKMAAAPFIAVALWTNGKRGLVAVAIFLLLYLLWMRGILRGWRFIGATAVAGAILALFSYTYQSRIRDIDLASVERKSLSESNVYVNFRIDYGRDAIIKQTIFAELHPREMRILDYRGQSLVFDLTFMVPRSWWPGKPYPYAVYATAAMLRTPADYLGWGTTTSWLEEAIANFSWFGLLLGPLAPALICAVGDRRRTPVRGILTLSVATLLLVVHLVAFISLFVIWLTLVLYRKPKSSREPILI